MENELEALAQNLAGSMSGKGGISLEKLMGVLSTAGGKRILSALLSDGGERVKQAAIGAKSGDLSGVRGIVASIAATEEGRELLSQLTDEIKK